MRSRAGGAKKRPTRYTASTSSRLARALSLHKKGRTAEALAAYRSAIEEDATSVDAWMNLGTAAVALGRAREAREAFARGLSLAAEDARAHRDAGFGLAAIGEAVAGRAAFERAVHLEPDAIGPRLGLSRLALETGDRDAAILHARAAVAAAPDDASSHLELHRALFDDLALEPAIECARRALALEPDHPLPRTLLAGALGWSGMSDEVAAILTPTIDPGIVDALTYCIAKRHRARAFSSKWATLTHALAQATREGIVVELGVRHGISTRILAAATSSQVHAFDSFEGLPIAWHDQKEGAFTTQGELPVDGANVVFHVGWFDTTLPAFVASNHDPIRLLHIDADLYESARIGLTVLGPRIQPGCVIVFDEYFGNSGWRQDEHRAWLEHVAERSLRYEYLAVSWVTGQGVVRVL